MTTFQDAHGVPVLAKESAEQVGAVEHFVVAQGRVRAIHIAGGKHGRLVDWADVISFGDDAVVVASESVVRDATDDREARALRGELDLVGKRVLTDIGDELGDIADVTFDAEDGTILSLRVDDGSTVAGDRLCGAGSYAVVIAASGDA
jgi:uncharacterized protein YrrD